MNAMDRRKFIKDMTLALAGTTAGLTINSCSLIRAGYGDNKGTVNHKKTLHEFRQRAKEISDSPELENIEKYLSSRNVNRFMVKDAIISLMAVGTFGGMSEEDRKHPEIQEMINEAAPIMDRTIISSANYLEQLSEDERGDIQMTMLDHPEILTTFQVEFDKAGRRNEIQPDNLDHFNALFNKCVWRMENQDSSAFIDELITVTDKSFKKVDIQTSERQELGKDDEQPTPVELSTQKTASDSTQVQLSPAELYRFEQYERWKKVQARGGNAMIWGIVQFGVGWALASSSHDALEGIGALGLFVGMTGGAIIALVGIIMAMVGTARMAEYD